MEWELVRVKAYAVIAGGGVKAVALVGALVAAQQLGIEFVGYGGTSAGAIIAMAAAAGYQGRQLSEQLRQSTTFTRFLDDGGVDLEIVREGINSVSGARNLPGIILRTLAFYGRHKRLVDRIVRDDGIYSGDAAKRILTSLLTQLHPGLAAQGTITFALLRDAVKAQLQDEKGETQVEPPLLKVVATDVRKQRQIVFPHPDRPEHEALNESVIDAVFTSMSYPFVFRPTIYDSLVLVDGGLSSNLPIFLFGEEQRQTGYPIIAFDIVDSRDWAPREEYDRRTGTRKYLFGDFGLRLFSTAMASTDRTNRREMDGVWYVKVPVDSDITLRQVPPREQEMLYGLGFTTGGQAIDYLLQIARLTENHIREVQRKTHTQCITLLHAFVDHIKSHLHWDNCRAYVMVPTDSGTRRVEYQVYMDSQRDQHMDIPLEKGSTGSAWRDNTGSICDITSLSQTDKNEYLALGALPPDTQRIILTFPIRNFRPSNHVRDVTDPEMPLLGTLSIDTSTEASRFAGQDLGSAFEIIELWAGIIARHLKP